MKGAITKMKKARKTKIYRTFRLPSFAGGLPALAITVMLAAALLFGVGGTKLALISAGLAMPEGGIAYIKTNISAEGSTEPTESEAQASAAVQNKNAFESEERVNGSEKALISPRHPLTFWLRWRSSRLSTGAKRATER